jgi:peptidoglycan/xylan/chitin deacetylase (PgdA/CDA1 family)
MRGAGAIRRLATSARRRLSRRGLVLLYHRVAAPSLDAAQLCVRPTRFADQLAILGAHTAPLSLTEFDARRSAGTLPPRAVAVTFDDGYEDNLTVAAPALAAAAIPATVFVTTGRVGSARGFWWDELAWLLLATPPMIDALPVALDDGGPTQLACSAERAQGIYDALVPRLRVAEPTARDAALARMAAALDRPVMDLSGPRACTPDELRALAASRGMSIGAHTVTHASMAGQGPAALTVETAECRRQLRAWLPEAPLSAFAYPYGSNGDISAAAVDAVRAAGYSLACANVAGPAWKGSDRWRVPRHIVRDWDAETFRTHLDRWFDE